MVREAQWSAVVLAVLLTCSSAQLGLNEEARPRKRSRNFLSARIERTREDLLRNVDCNVPCTQRSRDPVCGTNGRTYDSRCDLDRDICKKVKVQLKHEGECSLTEKCVDERRAKQEMMESGQNVYVPTCLADGAYSPVQCHNFTRFCWCANVDGSPVPDTFQQGAKPQCTGDRTMVTATESNKQERCGGRKKQQFIKNLLRTLMQEYRRERSSRRRGSSRGGGEGHEGPAVRLKFDRLDRDSDGQLRRGESRGLRKVVRKFFKPKKCAKAFPAMCDNDGNNIISRAEWIGCFTQGGSDNNGGDKDCKRKRCKSESPEPVQATMSCEREREQLLAENAGNSSILIPVCTEDGKYQPIQCYKEYCVCVDTETGNSLDGTGVANGTPDCSRPFPHLREWPGCKGKTKSKFLKELQEYLVSKVNENDRNDGVDVSSQSREEYAAVYHFEHFDKNNNKFIDKKEIRTAKKFITSVRKLKKCGKKLSRYCDVDKNQMISLEEWVACIVVPDYNGSSNGGGVHSGGRRFEDNPFHIYLTAEDEVVRLKYRNW